VLSFELRSRTEHRARAALDLRAPLVQVVRAHLNSIEEAASGSVALSSSPHSSLLELLESKKTTVRLTSVSVLLNRFVHAVSEADHYRRNLAEFAEEFVDDYGAIITPEINAKLEKLEELDEAVEAIKDSILAHFDPLGWSMESSSSSSSTMDRSMDRGPWVPVESMPASAILGLWDAHWQLWARGPGCQGPWPPGHD